MEELLFYGRVDDFSVASFILSLKQISKQGKDVEVLVNSGGGSVFAGWGMIAEFRKFKGRKKVTVHGNASSMLSVFLLFSDDTDAIKQSKFVLHRADAFIFDESVREILVSINKDMREAFEEKLDIEKLEEIGGVSMDRFFDVDKSQIDINLNADQAKEIGLINNVLNLSPKQAEALNKQLVEANCEAILETEPTPKEPKETKKDTKMKASEIKEKHPEAYQEILNEGIASAGENATAEEKERIDAWAAWKEVDAEAVLAGIQSGKAITPAQTQEFIVAMTKGTKIKKVESDSAEPTPTPEPETPEAGSKEEAEKAEEVENFESAVDSALGLTPKSKPEAKKKETVNA